MSRDLLYYYCQKWIKEIDDLQLEWLTSQVQVIPKVTIFTKIRSFQYKFALRAIVTNVRLCKYKIATVDCCTFCCKNVETLYHLFYGCEKNTRVMVLGGKIVQTTQKVVVGASRFSIC